jgi:hypothetical protein
MRGNFILVASVPTVPTAAWGGKLPAPAAGKRLISHQNAVMHA